MLPLPYQPLLHATTDANRAAICNSGRFHFDIAVPFGVTAVWLTPKPWHIQHHPKPQNENLVSARVELTKALLIDAHHFIRDEVDAALNESFGPNDDARTATLLQRNYDAVISRDADNPVFAILRPELVRVYEPRPNYYGWDDALIAAFLSGIPRGTEWV